MDIRSRGGLMADARRVPQPLRPRNPPSPFALAALLAILLIVAWVLLFLPKSGQYPESKIMKDLQNEAARQEKKSGIFAMQEPANLNGEVVPRPPYFLSAVLFVDDHAGDSFPASEFPVARLAREWLEYSLFAGVEHVYLYNANAGLEFSDVQEYVSSGYVTFRSMTEVMKRKALAKANMDEQQKAAQRHCTEEHGHENMWLMGLDLDEYPFTPGDVAPGFFRRRVKFESEHYNNNNAGQILLQCFRFLGKTSTKGRMVEQYGKRRRVSEGDDVDDPGSRAHFKPLWKASFVHWSPKWSRNKQVMHTGFTMLMPEAKARMNCYWGQSDIKSANDMADIVDDSIQEVTRGIDARKG